MGQQETFHKESSEYGCVKPVSSELCYGVGEMSWRRDKRITVFSLKDLREEASSTSTSSSFSCFHA